MNEAQSEDAVRFKRQFRNAIITFAIVEFIVIAFVVSYVAGWRIVE
jgi:hypothetical protein